MQTTEIQWCDSTVNPVMGCAGCELIDVCYAHQLHRIRASMKGYATTFTLPSLFPGRVFKAASWSDLRSSTRPAKPWLDGMPRLIFVSDMGDALSEGRYVRSEELVEYQDDQGRRHCRPGPIRRGGVPFDFLEREIMESATSEKGSRHIWLWLTKRPKRMAEFSKCRGKPWPANVWVGTSVTSTKIAYRTDDLLSVGDGDTTRFLSIEPLWEEVSLKGHLMFGISWVIVGGESRQRSRPTRTFDLAWARTIRDECLEFGIPFFLKQLGGAPVASGRPYGLRLDPGHGGNWEEWPQDLMLRGCPDIPARGR